MEKGHKGSEQHSRIPEVWLPLVAAAHRSFKGGPSAFPISGVVISDRLSSENALQRLDLG
jgi:hypothetical protein